MDRALAKAVVAKRFERQRAERRPLVGKHRGDLTLRRAVDAGVGPVRLPPIEIRLRGFERLEAEPFQRRLLRVADARLDLAFPIGIADAARQRDDTVMCELIAIERIDRGIVDVRCKHAFTEIVEDDDLDGAAQPTKRALVQLRPHLGARFPDEEPHRFPRVAQREDEEACASVLARGRVAYHRPFAVVDLRLLAWRRRNDDAGLGRRCAAQLHDEATDARIPGAEAVVVDQVLPDRHRVAPASQGFGDEITIGLAGARARGARRRPLRVGEHRPRNGGI